MEEHEDNPENNRLGAGINEQALQSAIEASGYPLQSLVIDGFLKVLGDDRWYSAQEEWSYIDQDEGTVRQLDGIISALIVEQGEEREDGLPIEVSGFLRQRADVLIECKQSELPFIFFLRDSYIGNVPRLTGMPHPDLEIRSRVGGATIQMSLHHALDLDNLPFSKDAPVAVSMSRVYRKNRSLELSGEESFRGLALPLLKATRYYMDITQPNSLLLFYDIRTVFPVAVLRAPMVGVRMVNNSPHMTMLPWVRVVRAEPRSAERIGRESSDITSFDVVHFDFLDNYVRSVLLAAQEVAKRVIHIAMPVITGVAEVGDEDDSKENSKELEEDDETEIWKFLKPPLPREQFDEWIWERSAVIHGSDQDQDQDQEETSVQSDATLSDE